MKLLCLLLVLFAILAVSSAQAVGLGTFTCCPENAFFSRCTSNCQPTCLNPNPDFCTPVCIPGCQCRDGWLVSNGRCVLPSQCPASPIIFNSNLAQQRVQPLQRQLGAL